MPLSSITASSDGVICSLPTHLPPCMAQAGNLIGRPSLGRPLPWASLFPVPHRPIGTRFYGLYNGSPHSSVVEMRRPARPCVPSAPNVLSYLLPQNQQQDTSIPSPKCSR
jgi:hypothetical protein